MVMNRKPAAVLEAYTRQLDAEHVLYRVDAGKRAVYTHFDGEHFRDVAFVMVFDGDGAACGLRVLSVARFTPAQLADAYEFCNRMNRTYRWLRLYVDGDRELTAGLDAVITPATAGAICSELLHRAVNIVDSICKELND